MIRILKEEKNVIELDMKSAHLLCISATKKIFSRMRNLL